MIGNRKRLLCYVDQLDRCIRHCAALTRDMPGTLLLNEAEKCLTGIEDDLTAMTRKLKAALIILHEEIARIEGVS